MEAFWIQFVHLYFPVTAAILAQIVFILLPVNLRSWRTDAMNAWTYCCIQTFVAGILFVAVPKTFAIFKLSDSSAFVSILAAFIAGWWKVIRTIPLEGSQVIKAEQVEQPVVTFDYFYNADRLRQLSEFAADDPVAMARHRALREMLVRRRVDRNSSDSDDA